MSFIKNIIFSFKNNKKHQKIVFIFVVTLLSFVLRFNAAQKLSMDYDERLYVPIAQDYAEFIKKGEYKELINYTQNIEHPILNKLLFASSLIIAEKLNIPIERFRERLFVTRMVSVIFGTLKVFIIALFSPLAAFFVGISSWDIKYTSETMFEAASSFFAVFGFFLFYISKGKPNKFFYASAVIMGAAFASKYITATTAVTLIPFIFIKSKKRIHHFFLYGIVAFFSFFIFNPILYTNTIQRLFESLIFHKYYSTGKFVRSANLPFYMQITYLLQSVPWAYNLFVFKLDSYIFISGLLGIKLLYKKSKTIFWWYLLNFIFLFIYPTKWPQYNLVFIPPLSFASALFTVSFVKFLYSKFLLLKNKATSKRTYFYLLLFFINVICICFGVYLFIKGIITSEYNSQIFGIYMMIINITAGFYIFSLFIKHTKNRYQRKYNEIKLAYSYLIPAITGSFVLVFLPLLFTLFLSLSNFSREVKADEVIFPTLRQFIGVLFFSGGFFWDTLFTTIWWTVINVVLSIIIGVGLALILERMNKYASRFYKIFLILPWVIPNTISTMNWRIFFDKRFGVVNKILAPLYEFLNIEPISWIRDGFIYLKDWEDITLIGPFIKYVFAVKGYVISMPFITAVFVNVWHSFPFIMLVAIAALQSIPKELYESADIDGATYIDKLRHITLPLMKPIMLPAIILSVVWTFNQFNIVLLIQEGNFARTSFNLLITVTYWIFRGGNFAFASAYSMFIIILLTAYTIFIIKKFKYKEGIY